MANHAAERLFVYVSGRPMNYVVCECPSRISVIKPFSSPIIQPDNAYVLCYRRVLRRNVESSDNVVIVGWCLSYIENRDRGLPKANQKFDFTLFNRESPINIRLNSFILFIYISFIRDEARSKISYGVTMKVTRSCECFANICDSRSLLIFHRTAARLGHVWNCYLTNGFDQVPIKVTANIWERGRFDRQCATYRQRRVSEISV